MGLFDFIDDIIYEAGNIILDPIEEMLDDLNRPSSSYSYNDDDDDDDNDRAYEQAQQKKAQYQAEQDQRVHDEINELKQQSIKKMQQKYQATIVFEQMNIRTDSFADDLNQQIKTSIATKKQLEHDLQQLQEEKDAILKRFS